MRAVALVHFYPPYRMAGSETMLHTMLSTLTDEGHDAFVVCTDMPEAAGRWTYERIPVFHPRPSSTATAKVAELRPDVIVTHHDHAALAIITARRLGVPSVFIQHNTFPSNRVILSMQPDLTVFNTEWVARDWRHHLEGRWMVVHPPVWARDHASPAGGRHVTLVNLNVNKGVHVFSHLAQLFPDVPFLGVEGAHGQQITVGMPPNVTVIRQTPHMRRDVWSRTRVLLMPSVYESYGMAAVEALASGIPVIAHPTAGLREALGGAGIFADRDTMEQWASALRRLVREPASWAQSSARALARSAELDPSAELKTWLRAMESLVKEHEKPVQPRMPMGLGYRPRQGAGA